MRVREGARMARTRFTPEQTIATIRQVERWRQKYDQIRPYSSLGYRSPAPEAVETGPLRLVG